MIARKALRVGLETLSHVRCRSVAAAPPSDMVNRVGDHAVQMFVGRGYMRENMAEHYFRELRVAPYSSPPKGEFLQRTR